MDGEDVAQETERNLAAARHSLDRQHTWLLLSFSPFPMWHPLHPLCRVYYVLKKCLFCPHVRGWALCGVGTGNALSTLRPCNLSPPSRHAGCTWNSFQIVYFVSLDSWSRPETNYSGNFWGIELIRLVGGELPLLPGYCYGASFVNNQSCSYICVGLLVHHYLRATSRHSFQFWLVEAQY